MSKQRSTGSIAHTKSSGNVFADLGLPHSEEDMLKVEVARAIAATIENPKTILRLRAISGSGVEYMRPHLGVSNQLVVRARLGVHTSGSHISASDTAASPRQSGHARARIAWSSSIDAPPASSTMTATAYSWNR